MNTDWKKKNVLVIGLGISGQAAATLLLKAGAQVFGIDDHKNPHTVNPEIHPYTRSSKPDLVVLSPGIPLNHPLVQELRNANVPIIGEMELALQFLEKQKIIGVTGTNGKTSTTLLITHALKSIGLAAHAVGNVGNALSDYFCKNPKPNDILVTEISSYQLDTLQTPALDIATLLNIHEDHLDRYPSLNAYAQSKCQILHCLKPHKSAYIHSHTAKHYAQFMNPLKIKTFGSELGCTIRNDGEQVFVDEIVAFKWPVEYRNKTGPDIDNALAAFAVCRELDMTSHNFLNALKSFRKPAHRLEFVREIHGVFYYNDSKGTNVHAVMNAVEALPGPIILIAGGKDKGAAYSPLIPVFKNKVKKILVLGEAAPKMIESLGKTFSTQEVNTLKEAVDIASDIAKPGDHILLSPACSSFDMFTNFEERGNIFKNYVYSLVTEPIL